MKIITFLHDQIKTHGIIEGGRVRVINNSIFDEIIEPGDACLNLAGLKPLCPASPSKIVCVGLNYSDHAKELGMPIPEEPIIFLKPPTSIIGPDDMIKYPDSVQRLDYEAELAIIIKKTAKDVPQDKALEYILGYTCLNDITARDLQKKDGQWTRAKSFDTFCPIGPYIVTDTNASSLKIELRVNNKIRQSSSTKNFIFGIEALISFISQVMTLLPGDIVATGTPKGVGPLSRGDEVEVKIEGIGCLRNTVA